MQPEIIKKEMIVFKNSEHRKIARDAGCQPQLSCQSFRLLDKYGSEVVNKHGKQQDENVFWNKCHVENATGQQ